MSVFQQEGNRLKYHYDAEELWLEPWGANSLRVRATKEAEMPKESWALLEAENDLRILEAGERVPLIKQDDNWAISLENVLALDFGGDDANEGNGGGEEAGEPADPLQSGFIRPQTIEGQSYEAYLKIFVAALPQETRVLRDRKSVV